MNIDLNLKLKNLSERVNSGENIKIAILGFGSVAGFLLEFLNNWPEKNIEIHICSRNILRKQADINLAQVTSLIRNDTTKKIFVHELDLCDIGAIERILNHIKPDFIVNSSRAYSGLKYGSISWNKIRAYGIWSPLSVKYIKNIMIAYQKSSSSAIVINTSYSDVVNPWLKSAGFCFPDFGSGNLNHLVPRIKLAVSEILEAYDLEKIKVVLATSHFHDVVISKEGQDENEAPVIYLEYKGQPLNIDLKEIFKRCAIAIPVDARRNMMNASSNFEIIKKIIMATKYNTTELLHVPGFQGLMGGYPVLVNERKNKCQSEGAKIYEEHFSFDDMVAHNKRSIALDGIGDVSNGILHYTPFLQEKVARVFGVNLPSEIPFEQIEEIASFLIDNIIEPNSANSK